MSRCLNPESHLGHEWLADADAIAYSWCNGRGPEYEVNYTVEQSGGPGWRVVRRIGDSNGAGVIATYRHKVTADEVADFLTLNSESEYRG